ncbi:hypothetical protein AAFF_G00201000 [Aldrovandia affinis]|uniref:Uncharacterized protein n=1 Tax=Aldrovandia affinis TaxID=143900 RepID=A0AAD7W5I9_9TELE|nr:hypothetical protein AAFF_G00201000 [Aldrovandia affinis]
MEDKRFDFRAVMTTAKHCGGMPQTAPRACGENFSLYSTLKEEKPQSGSNLSLRFSSVGVRVAFQFSLEPFFWQKGPWAMEGAPNINSVPHGAHGNTSEPICGESGDVSGLTRPGGRKEAARCQTVSTCLLRVPAQ